MKYSVDNYLVICFFLVLWSDIFSLFVFNLFGRPTLSHCTWRFSFSRIIAKWWFSKNVILKCTNDYLELKSSRRYQNWDWNRILYQGELVSLAVTIRIWKYCIRVVGQTKHLNSNLQLLSIEHFFFKLSDALLLNDESFGNFTISATVASGHLNYKVIKRIQYCWHFKFIFGHSVLREIAKYKRASKIGDLTINCIGSRVLLVGFWQSERRHYLNNRH